MPAFGRDGLLKRGEINDLADYVRELAGLPTEPKADLAPGASSSPTIAPPATAPAGKGNQELGAPNLTDAIGSTAWTMTSLTETIGNGRNGVMPTWGRRLDRTTIKALAVYVHSLGGEGSSDEHRRQTDPDDMPLFAAVDGSVYSAEPSSRPVHGARKWAHAGPVPRHLLPAALPALGSRPACCPIRRCWSTSPTAASTSSSSRSGRRRSITSPAC